MAQIQRPTKQGNATTYQGKVAAGYTTILASEVDADIDLMYSAWNQGVDGSNIQPGVITGGMLAPGTVGTRELTDGGVQTVDIGDGQVTNAKIVSVAWSKLSGGSVAAGGDLSGTYPSPALGTIAAGSFSMNPRVTLNSIAASNLFEIEVNNPGVVGFDSSKSQWLGRFDYANDQFQLWRSAPGTTSNWVLVFSVGAGGVVNGSVGRAGIAVNAIYGGQSTGAPPASYNLTGPSGWVNYLTLSPACVTRGGNVFLQWETNLCCSMPAGGAQVSMRWLRDGVPILSRSHNLTGPTYLPLPGLNGMDTGLPAGSHTYSLQLQLYQGNSFISSSGIADQNAISATEVG